MENTNNKSVIKGGVTFIELYQLAVVILKLCKVIDWRWWLVMLPAIIGCGIAVLFIVVLGVLVVLKVRNDSKIERLKKEAREKKYY